MTGFRWLVDASKTFRQSGPAPEDRRGLAASGDVSTRLELETSPGLSGR